MIVTTVLAIVMMIRYCKGRDQLVPRRQRDADSEQQRIGHCGAERTERPRKTASLQLRRHGSRQFRPTPRGTAWRPAPESPNNVKPKDHRPGRAYMAVMPLPQRWLTRRGRAVIHRPHAPAWIRLAFTCGLQATFAGRASDTSCRRSSACPTAGWRSGCPA